MQCPRERSHIFLFRMENRDLLMVCKLGCDGAEKAQRYRMITGEDICLKFSVSDSPVPHKCHGQPIRMAKYRTKEDIRFPPNFLAMPLSKCSNWLLTSILHAMVLQK